MGAYGRKRTFKEVPRNIKRIKLYQITKDRNLTSNTSCSKQLTVDLNLVIPKSEHINSEVGHINAENETCLSKNAGTVPPSTSLQGREEGNISKHMVLENDFSCHACQHKCATKSQLNRHRRHHIREKPLRCHLCDFRSSEKKVLSNHIQYKHTTETNFSCHICPYKFVTKSKLNIHLRKHTGEKLYKCEFCDHKSSRKSHLIDHTKRAHTKEKNFSCHICPYKCVTKSELNIHLHKHTGEQPYKCDLCDYKSSRKAI